MWGPTQPLRMQHVQGGAAASDPYAAVSRPRHGSGGAVHRHAVCMAMQLPYSEWLRCRDKRTAELRHCVGHARCSCTAQLYSVAGRLHGVDLA